MPANNKNGYIFSHISNENLRERYPQKRKNRNSKNQSQGSYVLAKRFISNRHLSNVRFAI